MNKSPVGGNLPIIVFFLLFTLVGAFVFYLPYQVVRDNTIASLNAQQLLLAKQAAKGIQSLFAHYAHSVEHLATHPAVIDLDAEGKMLIAEMYNVHKSEISAVTRVDAAGRIVYTVPFLPDAIGRDVSSQEHNRLIMETHRPVVSDVFLSVQGYRTIAYSFPVFKGEEYSGSVGILIPFATISRQYLADIVLGNEGYAWMLSKKGVELYCPVPGHTGRAVFETSSGSPAVVAMAGKMMLGEEGNAVYEDSRSMGEPTENIRKLAVYYPVQLPGGNFWSIVVATPERQALEPVRNFGGWWSALFFLLSIILVTSMVLFFRFRILYNEEQKLRRAEQKLLESHRLFSRFINSAHVPIAVIRVDGTIELINDMFRKLYGYTLEDIPTIEKWFAQAYPEEKERGERFHDWREKLKAAREDGSAATFRERSVTCKDGSVREVEFGYTMIDDRIIIILNDNTEKNRIERARQELLKRQERTRKMADIGLMAGGVAHDLNNILSGIVNYPELLLLDLPGDSPLRQPLESIRASGQRAAAVVEDLLTVARGVAGVREIHNLNTLIRQYIESPEYGKLVMLHPEVAFSTRLAPDLYNFSCSSIHIRKSLMNLVTNAAEAIQGKGEVTVATWNQYVDDSRYKGNAVEKGMYVVLSVRDTGSGIQEKNLAHIFEPFYTKKIMGKSGTGLGLTVVWNTVQDHGGTIVVESNGQGTGFELLFPASEGELFQEKESADIAELQGSNERILVVDDEPHQRDIAAKILKSLGYSVEQATSGEEALEYLRKNRVDLVLLDMLMREGMNGREAYERIIRIHPGQKAVIMSGFSQSDEVVKAQKLGAKGFIKKPYTMEKLGLAVKRELQNTAD